MSGACQLDVGARRDDDQRRDAARHGPRRVDRRCACSTGEDRFDGIRAEHDRLLARAGHRVARRGGQAHRRRDDRGLHRRQRRGQRRGRDPAGGRAAQPAVAARARGPDRPERRRRLARGRRLLRHAAGRGDPAVRGGAGRPDLCRRRGAHPRRVARAATRSCRSASSSSRDCRRSPRVEVVWAPDPTERERARVRSIRGRSRWSAGRPRCASSTPSSRGREAGECRTVLVLGEPGVGKTRIVTELLDLHRDDVIGLAARAYPLGATASLGLWTEAIERHLRALDAEAVLALCGPYVDDLAAILPSVREDRRRPRRRRPAAGRASSPRWARCSTTSARRAPLVVMLDDVHLADGSSWEALNYLARNLMGSRILLVLTARPVELGEHRIATEIVHGLEQDGLLRRRTLGPLSREDLRTLAAAWFDADRIGDPLARLAARPVARHLAVRGRAAARARRGGRRPRPPGADVAARGPRRARARPPRAARAGRAGRCSSCSRSSGTG